MSWSGAAAGATLGFIAGNVPGAVAGGYMGYNTGKNLPKKKLMDSGYGSRKRKYTGSGLTGVRKRVKTVTHALQKGSGMSRGAFLGKLGYRAVGNDRAVRITKRGGKRRKSVTTRTTNLGGPYGGSFKKPKKLKRTMDSRVLSQGCLKIVEQYGSIIDPDCVYLQHSTGFLNEIGRTLAIAILRKLFIKAGFKITNNHNEVVFAVTDAGGIITEYSDGIKLVLTTRDPITSAKTNIYFDTSDNQTFVNICDAWTDFPNYFINYMRNQNTNEPYKVALYRRDFATVVNGHTLAAEIYLEDSHMELNFVSNLCIQNRTRAATTGGTASEELDMSRVDVQPLKGWIYEFKNADSRVRHSGTTTNLLYNTNQYFNTMKDSGMLLIPGSMYGAPVTGVQKYGATEPLDPKYFANIAKATKIVLQPGEMKKTTFSWNLSGKITNTLRKLKVQKWDGVGFFSGMIGKSQMIALEEVMRTPSSNKIEIAYERELKIGAVVKIAMKQALLEPAVISENYSASA